MPRRRRRARRSVTGARGSRHQGGNLREGRHGAPTAAGRHDRLLSGAGFAWSTVIVALDVVTGRHADLIGLLGVGPSCAALTGMWRRTASAGCFAVFSAAVCGWPDGIFGSGEHLLLGAAVVAVAAAATAAVAVAGHA